MNKTRLAYRIHTARMVLRCWEPADAPLIAAALIESPRSNPMPWMPWAANEPVALSQRVKWLRECRGKFDLDQDYIYGVFAPDESRVIGGTGLHTRAGEAAREIGYWIHVDFTHRGLATELSAALTRVAFEVDQVNRVEIHCDPQISTARRCRATRATPSKAPCAPARSAAMACPANSMVWSLLRDEYPASPSASAQVEAYDATGQRLL